MQDGKWAAEKVIQVPGKKVDNWALPTMPGLFSAQTDCNGAVMPCEANVQQ